MTRWVIGWVLAAATTAAAQPVTLHVSPGGNDAWSGRLAKANAAKTDGPLASLLGARDAIRKLRAGGTAGATPEPVTVTIQGGTYRMAESFVLEPRDSFVTYQAAQGQRPVFSGGLVVAGWQKGEGQEWTVKRPE